MLIVRLLRIWISSRDDTAVSGGGVSGVGKVVEVEVGVEVELELVMRLKEQME